MGDLNSSNLTITQVGNQAGVPDIPVCSSNDNFFLNVVDMAGCMTSWIGWYFSLMFTTSQYQWLAVILFACVAVIAYGVLKLMATVIGGVIP